MCSIYMVQSVIGVQLCEKSENRPFIKSHYGVPPAFNLNEMQLIPVKCNSYSTKDHSKHLYTRIFSVTNNDLVPVLPVKRGWSFVQDVEMYLQGFK